LFYRLNVVRIALPPLRERREDIRLLVNYFLKKFAIDQGQVPKSISADALGLLERHGWPGNVRELENVIRRALVVAKGDALLPADLPPELPALRPFPASATGGQPAALPAAGPANASLAAAEVPALVRALFQHARRETSLRLLPAVERELVIQALQETRG